MAAIPVICRRHLGLLLLIAFCSVALLGCGPRRESEDTSVASEEVPLNTTESSRRPHTPSTDLPLDEGGFQTHPSKIIVVKLAMVDGAVVCSISDATGTRPIGEQDKWRLGTLEEYIRDRTTDGHPLYHRLNSEILARLEGAAAWPSSPARVLIDIPKPAERDSDPRLMIDKSIPWGFVTIVVDAIVTFNERRRADGKSPLGVGFLYSRSDSRANGD